MVKLFLEQGASPSLRDLLSNRCTSDTNKQLRSAYLEKTKTALCSCVSAIGTFKVGKLPNYMAGRTKDMIHHNRNDHNR